MAEENKNELKVSESGSAESEIQQVQTPCGTVDRTVDFCCIADIPTGFNVEQPITRLDTRFAFEQNGLCVDIEECAHTTMICGAATSIPVYQVRLRGYVPALFNVAVVSGCGIETEPGNLPRCAPGEEQPGRAFICCNHTVFVDNVLFCSASEAEAAAVAETVQCNLDAQCLDLRNFDARATDFGGNASCPGAPSCVNRTVKFFGRFDFNNLLNACENLG